MTVEELLEVARLHRLFAKSLRAQAAACVEEREAQLASRGDK